MDLHMVVTLLLYTQALFALVLGGSIALRESTGEKENNISILQMFMVFLWNMGYVIMLGTGDEQENLRYACRSVIMLAVLFTVIFCHYTLMRMISFPKKVAKRILALEVVGGLFVYPVIIARESVRFTKTGFGWTYQFEPYMGRWVYNIFITLVSLGVLLMSLYSAVRGKRKRDRVIGRYGLLCVVIMSLGMLTDTILPMFQLDLFPGSASAMFLCSVIIYVISIRRNVERMTVTNVSPYIFNSTDLPMLVVDEAGKIVIMNRAAGLFFLIPSDKIINHDIHDFFEIGELRQAEVTQNLDVKCKINDRECRLGISGISDVYQESLGGIIMITDMTDKISMIGELEMYRNHLQESLDEKTRELERVILQAISAVANTIDAKDEYTKGHSLRVAAYSEILARELGKDNDYVNNLKHMALLHDIGKIGVPDSVLNKPGKLTDMEFELIKQHTTIGAEILKDITMVEGVAYGAKYHHERYDGKGYPNGLKGEEIPYEARIIGIADAYDAMTSNRIYRKKLSKEEVVEELRRGAGAQFDPELVLVFIELVKAGKMKLVEDQEEMTLVGESNRLLMNILEKQNEQTRQEADYDYLTGLYNRKAIEREVTERLKDGGGTLLMIDLDHFKQVNDTYGHLMGDHALKTAASCMKEAIPENALIGRQGGDEFIVFLPGIVEKEAALQIAERVRTYFLSRVMNDDIMNQCSFSIGLSLPGTWEDGYQKMFSQADKALYYVKQSGRNDEYMFESETGKIREELSVNRDIEQIIEMFRNSDRYTGAFSVKVQELKKIFEFAKSFAKRYGYEMQVVLFTLECGDTVEFLEIIEKSMNALLLAVKKSLRSVDISTRYGSSQMIIILVDSDEKGVEIAANKIIQNFYKIYSGSQINLYYDSVNIREI